MAWVAVDKDNTEWLYKNKPLRKSTMFYSISQGEWGEEIEENGIELPKGSIIKLIGRDLRWEDEPVELK